MADAHLYSWALMADAHGQLENTLNVKNVQIKTFMLILLNLSYDLIIRENEAKMHDLS